MKKYDKKIEDDKIIFIDKLDGASLVVKHYEDDYIFDTIFIDEKFDLDFILYIVNELKSTKDICVLYFYYNSIKVENMLYNYGFRISNYQYTLKCREFSFDNCYEISDILDVESKNFYLQKLNSANKINQEYYNPKSKYVEYIDMTEEWTNGYSYRIYKQNGKIVGIVEFKVFEFNPDYGKVTNEVFNYNNKLCIRCIFALNDEVLNIILKDLLVIYKKDIIVNITYTDKMLKSVVEQLNGVFNFCQYTLIS